MKKEDGKIVLEIKDSKCIKKGLFQMKDKNLDEKAELDLFSKKKGAIKKAFMEGLSVMINDYNLDLKTDEFKVKAVVNRQLEESGLITNINEEVERIYLLLKRDMEQSVMYDKKEINVSFKIRVGNNVLKILVDKLEKSSETNTYRITKYCSSISSAKEEIELTAAILNNCYEKINITSFAAKSLIKTDKNFFGEGSRSIQSYNLEEPDFGKPPLNMEKANARFDEEIFKMNLLNKNLGKMEILTNFDENIKNIDSFFDEKHECKFCKYKRYCLGN